MPARLPASGLLFLHRHLLHAAANRSSTPRFMVTGQVVRFAL